MKRVVLIIVIVLGVCAVLWQRVRSHAASELSVKSSATATADVQRGELKITIRAEGRVSAKQSEKISHQVDGNLTIAKIVEEGKYVKKDDELVVFDSAKQKERVETAEAALKTASTDVAISENALEITRRENAEALAQAQFKYNAAKLELEKSEKGELPQQERGMLLKIEQAESELKQAKEAYEQTTDKEMVAQGFVLPVEIEQSRIRLRSAEIQLELANGELNVFRTYTRPVTLNGKHADLQTAQNNVAMIESVNANKLDQKKAELEAKQEHQRQCKSQVEEAQKQLAGCVLKAPVGGLVLYGEQNENQWWSRRDENIRVGGQVYMNQTIITLPNLGELIVKAPVPEADINKIQKNMRAIVTSDAYANMHEAGTVSATGNVAARNWMESTNHYDVTIDLRKGDLGIKPGVTTKVEIEVATLTNVLRVPVNAIFTHEGRNIAYVKRSRPEAREVKLGLSNDLYAEVKEGLSEGEKVLLFEPEHVELPPKSPGSGESDASKARETPAADTHENQDAASKPKAADTVSAPKPADTVAAPKTADTTR